MKSDARKMKHFRFTPKMIELLETEARETGRTQTKLLEIAFALFMSQKRGENDVRAAIQKLAA